MRPPPPQSSGGNPYFHPYLQTAWERHQHQPPPLMQQQQQQQQQHVDDGGGALYAAAGLAPPSTLRIAGHVGMVTASSELEAMGVLAEDVEALRRVVGQQQQALEGLRHEQGLLGASGQRHQTALTELEVAHQTDAR